MHAEVDEATAAGQRLLEEPTGVGRPPLRSTVAECGPYAGDVADAPGRDEVVRRNERRCEPRVLEGHEHDLGGRRRRDHLVRSRHRAGNGLVDEDVLARDGRGDGDVTVLEVGGGDEHGVDLVVRDGVLPRIDDASAPPAFTRRLGRASTPAGEDGHLDAGGPQRRQVDVVGRRPAADHGEADRHVSSLSATAWTDAATWTQSASE